MRKYLYIVIFDEYLIWLSLEIIEIVEYSIYIAV